MHQPDSRLSGGERARILIARLMLQPADVLILDEPTNDLDIPTLEILEEALLDFKGALVLVTHDRYLLDRVTNVVVGLIGRGNAAVFADYRQWEEWRAEEDAADASGNSVGDGTSANGAAVQEKAASRAGGKKKLSYMEQREYDGIETRVEEADARLAAAHERLEDHAVASDPKALTEALAEMEAAQSAHDAVYERWAALTEKLG